MKLVISRTSRESTVGFRLWLLFRALGLILFNRGDLQGKDTTLSASSEVITFSDTSTHWANDLIAQMSGFCGVASPLNESGSAFAPEQPGLRNYAAAATLRMLNCVKEPESSTSGAPEIESTEAGEPAQ